MVERKSQILWGNLSSFWECNILLLVVANQMQRRKFMQSPCLESPHSKCAVSSVPLLVNTNNDVYVFISRPFFLKNLSSQFGKWVWKEDRTCYLNWGDSLILQNAAYFKDDYWKKNKHGRIFVIVRKNAVCSTFCWFVQEKKMSISYMRAHCFAFNDEVITKPCKRKGGQRACCCIQ